MNDLHKINRWSEGYGDDFHPDVEAGLSRLKKRIKEDRPAKRVAIRRQLNWRGMAAAVAMIVVAGLAAYQYAFKTEVTEGNWQMVMTAAGETKEVVLPDGSEVSLNANSQLEYWSALATADTREVRLEGEAFFAVNRRPDQAFRITTEQAEVEVLGTSFNVRAYADEPTTEVEVATGRVAFRSRTAKAETLLNAEEAALLLPNQTIQKEETPSLSRQAWRTHRLVFRGTPLASAAPLIERYYQIEMEWEDQLSNCEISGDWQKLPLAQVFELIKGLTGLEVQQTATNSYRLVGQCQ